MNILWGIVLILFTLPLCWLAQVLNALAPARASRWGLTEPEDEVDPVVYADTRGEAIWDSVILWPLPVAGILLVLNNPCWAPFGLVGGGIYLYFAGRGIVVRLLMRRRGIRLGPPGTVNLHIAILILWGLLATITILAAVRTWSPS